MLESEIVLGNSYNIVFDVSLMQPACVLLQVAYGCDSRLSNLFETNTWLVFPTDNLKKYSVTGKQLKQLIRMTREVHNGLQNTVS